MKISVIIPTYKPKEYIKKCITSFCQQDFPKDKYEMIIILNGPEFPYRDELLWICNFYAEEGFNIKLFYCDTPGVSNARNMGLDKATGEHIIFSDDDDWVSQDYLSSLCQSAKDNTIVVSNVLQYNEDTRMYEANFVTNAFKAYQGRNNISLVTGRSFMSVVWGKLIPMTIISKARFNTNFSLGEDSLFMASISKNIKHIVTTPQETIYYLRSRSTSSSRKNMPLFTQQKNALLLSAEYIKMYIKDIRNNNFLFYLTRLLASLRKFYNKKYLATGTAHPVKHP